MLDKFLSAISGHPEVAWLRERARADGTSIYIVGGAVRDALFGNFEAVDLDFAVSGCVAMEISRKLARRFRRAFVTLDEDLGMARLVSRTSPIGCIDISDLRGADIGDDLLHRDFTINSIAVELGSGRVIDPLEGRADLGNKLLRCSSPDSFREDPLRVLRAYRFRLAHGLEFSAEMNSQIRAAGPGLAYISKERLIEELYKILKFENSGEAMREICETGIFGYFLPFDASFSIYEILEDIIERGRFGFLSIDGLKRFLASEFTKGRAVRQTLKLAALAFTNFNSESRNPEPLLKDFKLASKEARFIASILTGRKRMKFIRSAGNETSSGPAPLMLYDFFDSFGPAGIGLILLEAAVSAVGNAHGETAFPEYRALISIVAAYFDPGQACVIAPQPLLSGERIMELLGIPPCPEVGRLLAALKRSQVSGLVRDENSAIKYLREIQLISKAR